MKRILVALVASIALSGSAYGAGAASSNLNLTASVIAACTFSLSSTNLNLGSYDASTAGLSAPATIAYTCTKGSAPTFAFGSGENDVSSVHHLKGSASELITYTVSALPAALPAATGAPQDVTVTVNVAGAQYVSVGTYTDILVLNVNL